MVMVMVGDSITTYLRVNNLSKTIVARAEKVGE